MLHCAPAPPDPEDPIANDPDVVDAPPDAAAEDTVTGPPMTPPAPLDTSTAPPVAPPASVQECAFTPSTQKRSSSGSSWSRHVVNAFTLPCPPVTETEPPLKDDVPPVPPPAISSCPPFDPTAVPAAMDSAPDGAPSPDEMMMCPPVTDVPEAPAVIDTIPGKAQCSTHHAMVSGTGRWRLSLRCATPY
jgi:hypothetical protein